MELQGIVSEVIGDTQCPVRKDNQHPVRMDSRWFKRTVGVWSKWEVSVRLQRTLSGYKG